MPTIRKAWSSWNYRVESKSDGTWRDSNLVRENLVLKKIIYEHPLFTVESMQAQQKLPSLNGKSNVYYCGSYFRYGFHEDAFLSSVNLSEILLGQKPWN
jgi:predicted NAD/FAD-binding protein